MNEWFLFGWNCWRSYFSCTFTNYSAFLDTVLENVGTFDVVVGRDGGPEGLTVMVDYFTEDGTANAGSDFIPVKGTLTFYPEDRYQKINIEIVDDDVFEEDEHFYLHLTNLRVRTRDGLILDPSKIGGVPVAALEMPATATVMILGKFFVEICKFRCILPLSTSAPVIFWLL